MKLLHPRTASFILTSEVIIRPVSLLVAISSCGAGGAGSGVQNYIYECMVIVVLAYMYGALVARGLDR